jgi:hypothetical protein
MQEWSMLGFLESVLVSGWASLPTLKVSRELTNVAVVVEW